MTPKFNYCALPGQLSITNMKTFIFLPPEMTVLALVSSGLSLLLSSWPTNSLRSFDTDASGAEKYWILLQDGSKFEVEVMTDF